MRGSRSLKSFMKREFLIGLFAVLPAKWSAAQDCPPAGQCTGYPGVYGACSPRGPVTSFQWQDHFLALTRLGTRWMPQFGDGDSMTQALAADGYGEHADCSPPPVTPSDPLRESWYVPRDNLSDPGTAALWRLYNPYSGFIDHMDSNNASESSSLGYYPEFVLAYPFASQATGTKALQRYLKYSIFDHRTGPYDPPGVYQGEPIPSDYGTDIPPFPLYGYQRFNTFLERDAVLNSSITYLHLGSGGPLSVDFNKIWGNALAKITYNGTQLVSHDDIGSLVQTDLLKDSAIDPPGTCCRINPTEAGGVDLGWSSNTHRWAGSPALSYTLTQGTTSTLVSEVKPLNFDHDLRTTYNGSQTDRLHPLAWRGTLRRTTTLGHAVYLVTYPDVIKLRSEPKLDQGTPAAMDGSYGVQEVFFLRNPFVSGANQCITQTILKTLSLASGGLTAVTGSIPGECRPDAEACGCVSPPGGDPGCPIHDVNTAVIARENSSFSIGIMRLGSDQAGPPLVKFTYSCAQNPFNPLKDLTFGVDSSNTPQRTSYAAAKDLAMVVGPEDDVRRRLLQLHCQQTGQCVPAPAQSSLYTVAPCRAIDTRTTHQPALGNASPRVFVLAGQCNVPNGAKAVAVNATVVPTSYGFLTLHAASIFPTVASTLNFGSAQVRANNTVVSLDPTGAISAVVSSPGTTDVIIDVLGYFQ